MFGKNSRRSNHARPSRRSTRHRSDWSNSVVGSHAAGQNTTRRSNTPRRASSRSIDSHSTEVHQIGFNTRSVDARDSARHKTGRSRTASSMRRRSNAGRVGLIVGIIAAIAVALTLGTCAYRWSLSSSMALNDDSVSSALVSVSSDSDPYYVLLAGITDEGLSTEAASYLAVLRVDAQNNTISLLNIPSNISVTYSGTSSEDDMLRDAPHVASEGELVTQVASLLGQDINHYIRITDTDFVSLVDSLGGLTMTVNQYVDDPTVGTTVIDPGEQTLTGTQVLTLVSAKNYSDGYSTRSTVQNQVLTALLDAIESKGSLETVFSADDMAGKIGTDMSYDSLSSLASLYSNATVYSSVVPGSQVTSGDEVYWSVSSSSWTTVLEEFLAGEDMDTTVDTSGVDKAAYSIIVLNGAGVDGYSASVASVLTNNGWTVQETGNAESFVYTETLVVYKDADDQLAAEAIVQALGTGRAVSAGVYYSLTTDIQIYVGSDWTTSV